MIKEYPIFIVFYGLLQIPLASKSIYIDAVTKSDQVKRNGFGSDGGTDVKRRFVLLGKEKNAARTHSYYTPADGLYLASG